MKSCISAALCAAMTAGAAEAAAVFSFVETGGDVVGTLSGTLDLTGAIHANSGTTADSITPWMAELEVAGSRSLDLYVVTGPTTFGAGLIAHGTGTGDTFALYGSLDWIGVKFGYVSGSALSATLTFAGATFASLGITPGSYVWNLPKDTFTVTFGPDPSAVPLPAGLPLLAGGLGLLALWRRR